MSQLSLPQSMPALEIITGSLIAEMPDMQIPKGVPQEAARPASVMMLLVGPIEAAELVLTLRSEHLKSHAGQVSFPGGKPDAGDASLLHTALRECEEEIGWPAKNIEVLGYLPQHLTGTGYLIQPVVGYSPVAPDAFLDQLHLQQAEVASVWTEPVSPYLDEMRYLPQSREWQGRTRHYYVIENTKPVIWGATASIMLSFARCLNGEYDKHKIRNNGPILC